MKQKPVITVRGLSKKFFIGTQKKKSKRVSIFKDILLPYKMLKGVGVPFFSKDGNAIWALKDINFDVYRGERLGIIGKNGAGKTTLLKILSRLLYPTEGEARIRGRVTSLLGVGTGFNTNLTGRENIYLNASLYGLSNEEIKEKYDSIVEFSGVGKFIDTPVKYYSSGMHTRLAYAVAAHLDPDILLLDEVLAVGDMEFQRKCLQSVEGLTSGGKTILFVSHSMGDVIRFCNKAIWLEDGKIIEYGDTKSVVGAYSKRMLSLQASYRAGSETRDEDEKPVKEDKKEKKTAAAIDTEKVMEEKEEDHPEAKGAELISFEITDDAGNVKELFMRNEVIHVNVRYRSLRDDIPLVVNVHLLKDGVHVLTTHHEKIFRAPKFSVCQARTAIPANFLNRGVYDFSVAIVTPGKPIFRHIKLENILSFQIAEEYDSNQIFRGNYRGVVRPQFPWEISVIGE